MIIIENIIRATAIYTGGNIYCYYAELDNNNWIMGGEEWLIIVNENPLDEKNLYDSDFDEWQKDHLVKYINDVEYQDYLNAILKLILLGRTIKEFDNFSRDDLESRIVYNNTEEKVNNEYSEQNWKLLLESLHFQETTDCHGQTWFLDKNDSYNQLPFCYDNEEKKRRLYDFFSGALWMRMHLNIC